jgi:hypothetical protein
MIFKTCKIGFEGIVSVISSLCPCIKLTFSHLDIIEMKHYHYTSPI